MDDGVMRGLMLFRKKGSAKQESMTCHALKLTEIHYFQVIFIYNTYRLL